MSAAFGVLIATNAFSQDYEQGGDFTKPHTGEGVGYIKSIVPNPAKFTSLTGSMKADDYRGKRVRMSAFVKSENVQGWAGLWMRVDGPNDKCLAFDNMHQSAIKGTSDWKKYEVVLDVPEDSIGICYGVLMEGKGQVWAGDLKFETVGNNVSLTTDRLTKNQSVFQDLPDYSASTAGLPSSDEILVKYVADLGGRNAFEKINNMMLQGSVQMGGANGVKGKIQRYAKSPDKILSIYDFGSKGVGKEGYNGKTGWTFQSGVLTEKTGSELDKFKLESVFNREIKLKELYSGLELKGKGKIGKRNVYVIEATPAEGMPERWYFDTQTGLLLRMDAVNEEIGGISEIYFEDYREVDGIKCPFKIRECYFSMECVLEISEIKHNTDIDDRQFDKPEIPPPVPLSKEQTEWLKLKALPFETAEPAADYKDLMPLKKLIGNAHIVALGEATHGTSEFFKMKDRITRFLAQEMGFTIFAIEANMPEAYRMNDYVLTGKGDPKELLKGMYFWTWNTQEVLDMILWMREFNASGKGKIQFLGFDPQYPVVAAQIVRQFVEKSEPDYLNKLDEAYADIKKWESMIDPASIKSLAGNDVPKVEDIWKHMESRRARYLKTQNKDEVEWAIQNARIVLQAMLSMTEIGSRDASMAENVAWILKQAPAGTKIVLWAHNLHVARETGEMGAMMGTHLSKRFGNDYRVLGFAFHEGTYTAIGKQGLSAYEAKPSAPGSLDWNFHSTGLPRFILDLREASEKSPLSEWLTKPVAKREIGAVETEEFSTITAPQLYDALIFFDKTTASHPLPSAYSERTKDEEKGNPVIAPSEFTASADNPQRGIAIISSSIGTDYQVEDLTRLLEKGKFSPLVIDWAWITYHWDQTKFDEVNRLVESAKQAGITVAAMYRPRFLSDPTVPTQIDEKGRNDFQHGFEINYSSPEARKWGTEWGNKILKKCPGFDEIIIYNPRNLDRSSKTLELEKRNPHARNDSIWQFVCEARQAWSAQKAGVHIGVTAMQDADFWKRGVDLIDSAYPFLCVRNDDNLQDQLNTFHAVRNILGKKMRAALAKVTWEEEHRISPAVFAQFHKMVQSQKIPYLFWEFETLIDTGKYTSVESAQILSVTPDDLTAFTSKKTRQKTGCEPKIKVLAAQKNIILENSGKVQKDNSKDAGKPAKTTGKGGADGIPYAHMYEDFPAINQADLGLEKQAGKASLVYCSKGKKRLAGQIQTMLEAMHLMARNVAGACVRIHGLIVVGNRGELPAKVRDAHWLNVDRVPCLVQELAEDSLPLQSDFNQYMIFELLLHESVDIGIKEEFGQQGKMGSLMKDDIRWIVEGLANYCANKACQKFGQYGAIRFAAGDELKSLQKVTTPTLNLEETATWFPPGYNDPGDANYAYAAAHYVFARLASKHGEEWIRKTLEAMKSACMKKNTLAGSAEFCEIAGKLLHEDVRGLIQGVNVSEVKTFTESLLSPQP